MNSLMGYLLRRFSYSGTRPIANPMPIGRRLLICPTVLPHFGQCPGGRQVAGILRQDKSKAGDCRVKAVGVKGVEGLFEKLIFGDAILWVGAFARRVAALSSRKVAKRFQSLAGSVRSIEFGRFPARSIAGEKFRKFHP